MQQEKLFFGRSFSSSRQSPVIRQSIGSTDTFASCPKVRRCHVDYTSLMVSSSSALRSESHLVGVLEVDALGFVAVLQEDGVFGVFEDDVVGGVAAGDFFGDLIVEIVFGVLGFPVAA